MAAGTRKERLDQLTVARGLAEHVEAARRLIGAGRVLVDGRVCDKVGQLVAPSCTLVVKAGRRYVSRGGDKLEAGLRGTSINPQGWICADIGCSTGGFTDCLLQHGARKVFSVDVGYGLLDWSLRQDSRVVVLERINARYLTGAEIADPLDLAVVDASFISLEPLLAPLLPLFRNIPRILALVKPQFQLPREAVGRGGIVADGALHQQALDMVRGFGRDLGLCCAMVVPSPILGTKGNQEFFMLLTGSTGAEDLQTDNLYQGEHDEKRSADPTFDHGAACLGFHSVYGWSCRLRERGQGRHQFTLRRQHQRRDPLRTAGGLSAGGAG